MKFNLFKSTKLSKRISFIYAVIFLITIFVMNAVILITLNRYVIHTSAVQLNGINTAIQSNVITLDDLNTFDFNDLAQTNENTDIVIFEDNTPIINTGSDITFPIDSSIRTITSVETKEITSMYLSDTLQIGDTTYYIQIIKNMDNERDYFNTLLTIIISIDIVIAGLSLLVGYYISKKVLSPIDVMTKQAQRISTSNLSDRIEIVGPDDELSRLASTFNDLIERLSEAYIMQNQFALNASHELSTPLAVINGYIDLISRWGKEKPEIYEEAIQTIKSELTNMTSLLDSLYTISKTDNELVPIERSQFDLSDLIKQIIKEEKLIYNEQSIELNSTGSIIVNADRKLFTQMIRALLDNAVKFNRDNNPITIHLQKESKHFMIEIIDQGMGIAETDINHIFERFYRIDKARSRTIGGTGLGLSIVKWIVDMHKGTIQVNSQLNQGTTISITLPINSSDFS
jgi:signal transduction histidine kinase